MFPEPPIGQAPGDAYLFGPSPTLQETAVAEALEAAARKLAGAPPQEAAVIIAALPVREVEKILDILATTSWGPYAGTSYDACAQRLGLAGAP